MNVDWDYPRLDASLAGDADFPQRACLGDTALVAAALADLGLLPSGSPDLALSNVWFVPGRSLCAVYEQERPAAPGVYVFDFAKRDDPLPEAEGRWSPRLAARVRVFPDDPGLPFLPSLVGDQWPPEIAVPGTGWKLLSYLPGARCTIGRVTSGGRLVAVGKMQAGVSETHHRMAILRHEARGRFGLAEPLACDPARSTRWEGAVPGDRLDRLDPQRRARGLQNALQGLAALHATSLPDLPERGADVVFRRVARKVAKRVRTALPGLQDATDALCTTLGAGLSDLQGRPAVTLHGDFHTANILFDDDRPAFIDLDELAAGDPVYDLALFASRLLLVGVVRPDQMDDLARLAASVPSLYRQGGGEPVPPDVFAWYVATLILGRQVKTCIRHSIPNLQPVVGLLIRWAGEVARHRTVDARLFAGR